MPATARVHALHARRNEAHYEDKHRWDEEERGEAVRPYRLWDAVNRQNFRWRCYSDPKRAHMGALIEARWSGIGATVEVYDARTGRLLGQYTRRVNSIQFMGA